MESAVGSLSSFSFLFSNVELRDRKDDSKTRNFSLCNSNISILKYNIPFFTILEQDKSFMIMAMFVFNCLVPSRTELL